MSLESDLAEIFAKNNWTWNLVNGSIVPDEEDIQELLDEAAKRLFNEPVETQLQVGRLIIKKKPIGHDVYIYVGPYE